MPGSAFGRRPTPTNEREAASRPGGGFRFCRGVGRKARARDLVPMAPELPPDHVWCPRLGDWRSWLEAHHRRTAGVWLVYPKRSVHPEAYRFEEAIEEALCWGWIDSQPGKVDAGRGKVWFAPRRPGSAWSALNQRRVARLEAAGRMRSPGRAAVEAARADGSWNRLDGVEAGLIPEDLGRALDAHPPAAERFAAFPRGVRRGILEWIEQAKRPATRARRVEETARLAQKGERANQWPRR